MLELVNSSYLSLIQVLDVQLIGFAPSGINVNLRWQSVEQFAPTKKINIISWIIFCSLNAGTICKIINKSHPYSLIGSYVVNLIQLLLQSRVCSLLIEFTFSSSLFWLWFCTLWLCHWFFFFIWWFYWDCFRGVGY